VIALKGALDMRFDDMPPLPRRLASRTLASAFTWLRAVVVLGTIAIATIGSSARIGGEMNAALQAPGARAMVILLLATPLALAFRHRSLVKSEN
jgi:hypothetical protein